MTNRLHSEPRALPGSFDTRLRSDRNDVIVVAHRAPLRHDRTATADVTITRSASGLITALEPLVQARRGTWIAYAAGDVDALIGSGHGGVPVVSGEGRYRVRYVPLPSDVHRGFYEGFANEGLWPLCHDTDVQPTFRQMDQRMYRAANARFAEAVVEEAGGGSPLVLVQDYHFALVPRMLARWLPAGTVTMFWHIPWPAPTTIATCGAAHALLDGMLGSSLVGLQTPLDCANFIGSAAYILGARVDLRRGVVEYRGRTTLVRPFPVGVDWANAAARFTPAPSVCREMVLKEFGLAPETRLVVGVDRLDYTKGLEEKVQAVERLLEQRPDLRGRLVLLQIAEPSRTAIAAYQETAARVRAAAARVNERFGADGYRPIVLLETHWEAPDLYRLYRAADVCYVGSLHDGMNLVAKEFVLAREDERGVLVLSRRAGATSQLRDALSIDPRDIAASAGALGSALAMPAAEQALRMGRLRLSVRQFDARWWAERFLDEATAAGQTEREPEARLYGPARVYASQADRRTSRLSTTRSE